MGITRPQFRRVAAVQHAPRSAPCGPTESSSPTEHRLGPALGQADAERTRRTINGNISRRNGECCRTCCGLELIPIDEGADMRTRARIPVEAGCLGHFGIREL